MSLIVLLEVVVDPLYKVMGEHLLSAACIVALLGVIAYMQRKKEKKQKAFFDNKKYYSDN